MTDTPKKDLKSKVKSWLSETGNQIPISVVLSVALGIILNEFVVKHNPINKDEPFEGIGGIIIIIGTPGDLWIRALKSIVIPLIVSSMIMSMQSLKKIPGGGGKIANGKINNPNLYLNLGALGFYLGSTIFGLIESVIFIILILIPNLKGTDWSKYGEIGVLATKTETITEKTTSLILGIIPENLISSMATGDLISVITMAVVIGCLLIDTEESPSAFTR